VPPTATVDGDTLDTEITGPVTSDEPPDGAGVAGCAAPDVDEDRVVVVVVRWPEPSELEAWVVVGSLTRDDVVAETSVVLEFADTSSMAGMDELPLRVPSSDPHAVANRTRQPIKTAW